MDHLTFIVSNQKEESIDEVLKYLMGLDKQNFWA